MGMATNVIKRLMFEETGKSRSGKVKIWNVKLNNQMNISIGSISWQNSWRQYVFRPTTDKLTASCLDEISQFIYRQHAIRRMEGNEI